MSRASLYAAGAVVLVANAVSLTHAARNRSGEPEAGIVMTGHELPSRNYRQEDSGVELFLSWLTPDASSGMQRFQTSSWLNRQKLSELGFDCRMDPSATGSDEFYRRQQPRRAFAAFEYNGPAFTAWERNFQNANNRNSSRLVLIDAAADAPALRRRHPDRHSVLILPVAVRISRSNAFPALRERPAVPAMVVGFIEVSTSVHVPRPFSETIPAHSTDYRVHLKVGRLYDPWVAGVERIQQDSK